MIHSKVRMRCRWQTWIKRLSLVFTVILLYRLIISWFTTISTSRYRSVPSRYYRLSETQFEHVCDVIELLKDIGYQPFLTQTQLIQSLKSTESQGPIMVGIIVNAKDHPSYVFRNIEEDYEFSWSHCEGTGNIGGFSLKPTRSKHPLTVAYFENVTDQYMKTCKFESSKNTSIFPFGDVCRSLAWLSLNPVSLFNSCQVYIPSDMDTFKFDYSQSKHMQCNETSRDWLFEHYPEQKHHLNKMNKRVRPGLLAVNSVAMRLRKHIFIAAGTLLGWYRQCGIIEAAKDVDFAMFETDFEPSIIDSFLGNSEMRIWAVYGDNETETEIRMTNGMYTFDLFALRKLEGELTSLYQVNDAYHRRYTLSFKDICSTDLIGVRVQIPCNSLAILENDYGAYPKWLIPRKGGWKSIKLIKRFSMFYAKCVHMQLYNADGQRKLSKYFNSTYNRTVNCS